MKKVKIITDSCSDLSGELLEKYGIDYARMNTVYQGKEKVASLTWEEYSPKKLYDIMRGGERITTTQVPVQEFIRIFRRYLDEGFDIIYIGCSSKQSGSVNTGTVAAKDLLGEYRAVAERKLLIESVIKNVVLNYVIEWSYINLNEVAICYALKYLAVKRKTPL